MPGWSSGRPIYHRLPEESEAYQQNPLVDAITTPYDAILMEYKGLVENFERDFLDPDTARVDALDWLAQLCGFTGEYWDSSWTVAQKRELIKRSHSFIWANKGSQVLLEYLLDVFSINARIYLLGQFLADINKIGDLLGGDLMRYYVMMPLEYLRTSREWELVERLNRLYMPCFADSRVVYEQFYCDFSVIGDPLFG
jgi:Phage tail protein (Tail_P2_I)